MRCSWMTFCLLVVFATCCRKTVLRCLSFTQNLMRGRLRIFVGRRALEKRPLPWTYVRYLHQGHDWLRRSLTKDSLASICPAHWSAWNIRNPGFSSDKRGTDLVLSCTTRGTCRRCVTRVLDFSRSGCFSSSTWIKIFEILKSSCRSEEVPSQI